MSKLSDLKLPNVDSIPGFALYAQYAQDEKCTAYFSLLKNRLHRITQERLELLKQISWDYQGDNEYIQLYYETLFGLQRTVGETKVANQYDTGKQFDDGLIYDDTTFDGFLDLDYYKLLVKFFFSYSEENYTLGWVYSLVCEFCQFEPSQVTITENYTNIVITCPRTRESVLLEKIFLDKQNYLCVPIEDITFNLQDTTNKKTRSAKITKGVKNGKKSD